LLAITVQAFCAANIITILLLLLLLLPSPAQQHGNAPGRVCQFFLFGL